MTTPKIIRISLAKVRPDPEQPRKSRDDEKFTATVESIRTEGVQNPIHVRKDPDPNSGYEFMIVNGEGRYLASLDAGKTFIPAIVKHYRSDKQRFLHQLMDNEVRENMNLKDVVMAYKRLADEGMSVEKMAKSLGKKPASIEADLALLNLQEKFLDLVSEGKIPISVGRLLAEVKPSKQERIYSRLARARSTKEQTAIIRTYLQECRQQSLCLEMDDRPSKNADPREVQQFAAQFLAMARKFAESELSGNPEPVVKSARKRLAELEEAAKVLITMGRTMETAIAEHRARQA